MRRVFRKKLFVKYAVLMVMLMILPFAVLSGYIYYSAVIQLKQQVEVSSINKLMQVRSMVELQYRALEQTAANISLNPKLTPYMVTNEGIQAKETVEELLKHRSGVLHADEMWLYLKGGSHIFSPIRSSDWSLLTS